MRSVWGGAAAGAEFFNLGDELTAHSEWVAFLAASGAVVLTFLAGAELDPDIVRMKLTEVSVVGVWDSWRRSLAAPPSPITSWGGTRMPVFGSAVCGPLHNVHGGDLCRHAGNRTEFGKGILASCFVTDLGTVIALGLLFAPFTYKTLVCITGIIVALITLASITAWLTQHYGHRTAAIRTKWVMLTLFGLGALTL